LDIIGHHHESRAHDHRQSARPAVPRLRALSGRSAARGVPRPALVRRATRGLLATERRRDAAIYGGMEATCRSWSVGESAMDTASDISAHCNTEQRREPLRHKISIQLNKYSRGSDTDTIAIGHRSANHRSLTLRCFSGGAVKRGTGSPRSGR
jgi:hypothetical protein